MQKHVQYKQPLQYSFLFLNSENMSCVNSPLLQCFLNVQSILELIITVLVLFSVHKNVCGVKNPYNIVFYFLNA